MWQAMRKDNQGTLFFIVVNAILFFLDICSFHPLRRDIVGKLNILNCN